MNVSIKLNDFDENKIYFNKPVENTVIDDSKFFRITYSDDILSITGVHIRFNISSSYDYNHCNKNNILLNLEKNKSVVSKLCLIEKKILNRFFTTKKTPVYKIWNKLNRGNFQLFTNEYVLKISGIWETDKEYGITYRFFDISNG